MPVREEIQFATPGEPRTLAARFDTPELFSLEYACNLSQGGLFIETADAFELRELVSVELVLAFRDERLRLDGEVVSVRPPGIVGAPGGVAVQLLAPASEIRDRLGPLAKGILPDDLPAKADARSAPRTSSRVQARVGDGGDAVDTLDLSTRGALLEATGPPPAVGETIAVALQHPVSGEEYKIEGTVVRHHEENGAVKGVGVRFETNVVEQAGMERFVEDVQAAAHARQLGAIRGPIDQLGLASLLQMFGASAPAGTLHVRRDALRGVVVFEGGVLRAARVGDVSGPKALARLLAWRDGAFEFHAERENGIPEDPPHPLDAAIFEAVRQIDELARTALPSSMGGAALRLDRDRLGREPGPLEKVEEAVVDLVAAGFDLDRVLDVIPVPDAEIHAAVRALLERGVLLPSG
jgi:Tfp pilus assembly protein PilZ